MRLAIISDIHEDFISLQGVLRAIEKFNCEEIICLGDISGYSVPYYNYLHARNAHGCLSLIRSNCSTVILGNHDIHAASIVPKNNAYFQYPENWYQLNYHERKALANNALWLHEENDLDPLYKEDDIEYLKSLPEVAQKEFSGLRILFSHYVYPNISGLKKEFYTYTNEFKKHFDYMKSLDCQISFTGHAHVKGFFIATRRRFKQYRYKSIRIRNTPCCIGIPPVTSLNKRNGFCIFDTDEMSLRVVKL
jgi:predicted phosphodiesterase